MMFKRSWLKASIKMTDVIGHPCICVIGHCDNCGKENEYVVVVYPDLTARRAFEQHWDYLNECCPLTES